MSRRRYHRAHVPARRSRQHTQSRLQFHRLCRGQRQPLFQAGLAPSTGPSRSASPPTSTSTLRCASALTPPVLRTFPFGPSLRPLCWTAAHQAAAQAVALSRSRAPPHVVRSSLTIATYHACVTAAAEIAQQCGVDITVAKARTFGRAPFNSAGLVPPPAVAAQSVTTPAPPAPSPPPPTSSARSSTWQQRASQSYPSVREHLNAIVGTCDRTVAALGNPAPASRYGLAPPLPRHRVAAAPSLGGHRRIPH